MKYLFYFISFIFPTLCSSAQPAERDSSIYIASSQLYRMGESLPHQHFGRREHCVFGVSRRLVRCEHIYRCVQCRYAVRPALLPFGACDIHAHAEIRQRESYQRCLCRYRFVGFPLTAENQTGLPIFNGSPVFFILLRPRGRGRCP